VGEVLRPAEPDAVAALDDPCEGQIVREMSAEDKIEAQRIRQMAGDEIAICQKYVRALGLQMELVDVEHIYGGERVIVYYLAENRVDFRELVRQLAAEFQTRIEMRQIGVRDEAKLLADYGDCGEPVCCNNHLVQMPPVSMKMAKLQKATLDPSKISGRCGRLKCCLRYEYDTYLQIRKELPRMGALVMTPEGPGKVIGQEIIASQVLVITEDRRRVPFEASEVRALNDEEKQAYQQDQSRAREGENDAADDE
jgi:cell fate regulator YaaT (PSP1 superfamily)